MKDPALRDSLKEVQREAAAIESTRDSVKSKVVEAIATASASEAAQFVLRGLAGLVAVLSGVS